MAYPKATLEELRLRGSWRAKLREPTPKPKVKAKRRQPFSLSDEELHSILTEIPGYDPFSQKKGFYFHSSAGKDVIRFFHQELVHVKGKKAGQPFLLEKWQAAIVANLFGWKRESDGLRRYREAFIYVGRKNGKTPMVAGIICYILFNDPEAMAELYGAACEYKQASLVFQHARGMVRANPSLLSQVKIFDGQVKSIQLKEDFSTYRVISSDADSAQGFNTSFYVVDETHALGGPDLVDALETSTGARAQPLGIHITTADYHRESVCNEKYKYACNVRDGIIDDPSYLPIIYESHKDADWTSPETWRSANPNLGVSIDMDYLKRACEKAQNSPRFENTFRRFHLNQITQQLERFLSMDKWEACAAEYAAKDLAGKPCYGGLDMASNKDVAALVLLFHEEKPAKLLCWFWAPEENAVAREKKDKVPYVTWARQGHMTLTDGNKVDFDVVKRKIVDLDKVYNIQEIALDRWNTAHLQTQLDNAGIAMLEFGQGFASMSGPTKYFEGMVLDKEIAHNGNPVLTWMMGNLMVKMDESGNVKPDKKKSSEKIDGVVSTIMAIGAWNIAKIAPPTVYQSRGLVTI